MVTTIQPAATINAIIEQEAINDINIDPAGYDASNWKVSSKAEAWERLDRVAYAISSGKYFMVGNQIKIDGSQHKVCALGAMAAEFPYADFGYTANHLFGADGSKLKVNEIVYNYYGISTQFGEFKVSELPATVKNKIYKVIGRESVRGDSLSLVDINDLCSTSMQRMDLLSSVLLSRPNSLLRSDLS